MDESPVTPAAPDGRALGILLENHRAFLRYLERRVGSRQLAEDILQDAFARNLAKVEDVPDDALLPWFYRTLRNATIDHYRRRASAEKVFEAFAKDVEASSTAPEAIKAEICACVTRLAETLKPEYAEVLRAVEIDGTPVKTFAERKGLSPSNAGVRLFRAREALRKRVVESCRTCAEHGCLDCTCSSSAGQTSPRGVMPARPVRVPGRDVRRIPMERDVVCGMPVDPAKTAGTSEYKGKTYYFCSPSCKARFDANPGQYADNG